MTQWTLTVPEEIDRRVHHYLQMQGGTGDLSTFVQEAVGGEILRRTIREIQEANVDLSPEEAQSLADEAVAWTRANLA